jgi:hypothetical protein
MGREHELARQPPSRTPAPSAATSSPALPRTARQRNIDFLQSTHGNQAIVRHVAAQRQLRADVSTPTLLGTIEHRLLLIVRQAPPLMILLRQVQKDMHTPPADTIALRRHAEQLSDALVTCEPALHSLLTLKKAENYLPGVAQRIVRHAAEIEALFVGGLLAAYSDVKAHSLVEAERQLGEFANFVVDQTLGPYGLGREVTSLPLLRYAIVDARAANGRGPETRLADRLAGLPQFGINPHTRSKVLEMELSRIKGKRALGQDVSKEMYALIEGTRLDKALLNALAVYEQFVHWRDLLDRIGGGAPYRRCLDNLEKLDKIIGHFESASGEATFEKETAGRKSAAGELEALLISPQFQQDQNDIIGRIGTLQTVDVIKKVVVITAVAAFTAGIAGEAAAGMVAEELGTGFVSAAAGFGAEVFAFTVVSRALEGELGAPGFGKDLVMNALTFGVLKSVNKVFARLFALRALRSGFAKGAYKVGQGATAIATLQLMAEWQYYLEHHHGMPGDERLKTLAQNTVLTVALELGHFIAKDLKQRGLAAALDAKLSAKLATLDAGRAQVKQALDALKAGKLSDAEIDALLAKIEDLYLRELAFLDEAAKSGVKAPKLRAAIEQYRAKLADLELQLAKAGVGAGKGGPQVFRPVRPGVVAYGKGARATLERFYKEQDGGKLQDAGNGKFIGTLPDGEQTVYLPEDLARVEERQREQERRAEEQRQRLIDRLVKAMGPEHAAKLQTLSTKALETAGRLPPLEMRALGSFEAGELERMLVLDVPDVQRLARLKPGHVRRLLERAPTPEHLSAAARLVERLTFAGASEKSAVDRTFEIAGDSQRLLTVAQTMKVPVAGTAQRIVNPQRAQPHEYAQALDFLSRKGSGVFEFGPQGTAGVEGDYVPADPTQQRVPVSMKVYTTLNVRTIVDGVNENAGNVPAGRAELFAYSNLNASALLDAMKDPNSGASTAARVFKKMTFICPDGVLVFDSGRWRPVWPR